VQTTLMDWIEENGPEIAEAAMGAALGGSTGPIWLPIVDGLISKFVDILILVAKACAGRDDYLGAHSFAFKSLNKVPKLIGE